MSTSENEKSARRFVNDEPGPDWAGNLQALPAGLPDPGVLARMANEFFTALPAPHAGVPAAPYTAEAAPGAEASSLGTNRVEYSSRPTTSIPTAAQLRAAPSTLSAADPDSQILAGPHTLPSGVPAAADATHFLAPASLSFLEDIRPLASYSRVPPPIADYATASKIPSETELQALAGRGLLDHVGVTLKLIADRRPDEIGAVRIESVLHHQIDVAQVDVAKIDRDLLGFRRLRPQFLDI